MFQGALDARELIEKQHSSQAFNRYLSLPGLLPDTINGASVPNSHWPPLKGSSGFYTSLEQPFFFVFFFYARHFDTRVKEERSYTKRKYPSIKWTWWLKRRSIESSQMTWNERGIKRKSRRVYCYNCLFCITNIITLVPFKCLHTFIQKDWEHGVL
jgi:hypothetical protein